MEVIENRISPSRSKRNYKNSLDIKGAYLNARSINPEGKLDDIKSVIDNLGGVDIICLVETWLNQQNVKFFKIPSYVDYHHVIDKRGGGIAVYLSNKIKCLNLETVGDIIQIMKLKLKIKNKIINLVVCYNPHIDELSNCLEMLKPVLQPVN